MWYENNFRRHLCDMHIDDWNKDFLCRFSPEEYVENLKTAKIKSAMLYFQSHVGLCYYPTKSGKLHNGFKDKPDAMKRLAELCKENGISVTGYYSLIYNNWAHDNHPEWRMVCENGKSQRELCTSGVNLEFSDSEKTARYGLCCPNNMEYRRFVKRQITEISQYFKVDGMFFDMLFWTHMCHCKDCKKRWESEVGGSLPTVADWSDDRWLLHMQKRREWMGEFANWVTDLTKKLMPGISVEHNLAGSALADGTLATCEEVISASDFAGGDLYGGPYSQSFACKFYRNVTKNQPFEYMISRCAPNLAAHTQIKSHDILSSVVFLTAANLGATLVIDAVDPKGTMNSRVYSKIGEVFDELVPYEPYLKGSAVEEVGIYYSLKSKFNPRGERYTNYLGTTNCVENFVSENVLCGITGGFCELKDYKLIVAPALTKEDAYDNSRIIDYVKNGGCLYFSGADNAELLKEFFGAELCGYTKERVVYVAPEPCVSQSFEYFDATYPLNFEGRSPVVRGINEASVLAKIVLPYTNQDTAKFASIHSNPPGIKTDIPAMAAAEYGKGRVLWSAVSLESVALYDHRSIFLNLIKKVLGFKPKFVSNAPKDVEITVFKNNESLYVCTVLLNDNCTARSKTESFSITLETEKKPKSVCLIPSGKELDFVYDKNGITFSTEDMKIFNMYRIII